jgi:polar amino acid transport system substrate-binding protein
MHNRLPIGVLLLALPAAATAQIPLRWGMDETGGAPYVYDQRKKGFEVELAEYLAKELGRTSKPVSGEWKDLPLLLDKPMEDENRIDIVLNGYEYSKQFREQSSIPYYVYRLTLTVNAGSSIKSWEDLRRRRPDGARQKVVVLESSAALRYMQTEFKDDVDLEISNDVSSAYDLVAREQSDATVQDSPATTYFVRTAGDDRLRIVSEQRAPNFYVILTRADDHKLRAEIDGALRKAIRNGTLKAILEKYDLWNVEQERLQYWAENPWPPPIDYGTDEETKKAERPELSWSNVFASLGLAASRTILLALASFPLAIMLGLLIATCRVYGPGWLRVPCTFYVEIIRGTPLLLQLFLIFYVVPTAFPALAMRPIWAGIIGLAINYSAYEAENFRAGLQAISKGQMEAALALGMTPLTAIRRIIVPQALRIVIPPLTNDFIALFKDTSVCSIILITELSRQYNVLYNNHREHILLFAALTALIYLMLSYPLSLLAKYVERRFRTGRA